MSRTAGSTFLLGALAAFVVANVIHNRFGLDPAVLPAAILAALNVWRPHRGFLLGAAIAIALPAFSFLKWSSLTDPGNVWPFLNHVALLLAGVFAVATIVRILFARTRGQQASTREG